MKALMTLVTLALLSLIVAGCNQGGTPKDKTYDIKGKVVAVDTQKKKVTLDHEDIPGLMKAMQMAFSVENEKTLEGIKAGDQIHGKLKVQGSDYVIVEMMKH